MPSTLIIDWAIVNSAIAVITYAILEMLLVLSYILQELREESFIEISEKKEPSDYDSKNNNREKSEDKEAPQQGATPDRVKSAPVEL
jgi:hypothetical protein